MVVLSSIEDTLQEQNTKFTPTAYFAALLALLKQTISSVRHPSTPELATSAVYLLDIVSPFVPAALRRSQFNQIFSLLLPLISQVDASPPLLKSSIGCLESVLTVQDAAAWALPQSQIGPRKAVSVLLVLAIDGRPKIRKRAQEALTSILQHHLQGPALDHPAADLCASTALGNLSEAVEAISQRRKQQNCKESDNEPDVIHALQLTKTIATASRGWPSKKIEPLCELLLSISRSNNEYLVMDAFKVFEVVFEGLSDGFSSSKLPRLLDTIIDLKPARNDSQLLPPWIAVLSRGYDVFAQVNPDEIFAKLPDLLNLVSDFLTSPSHNIRISASECLISFFSSCVPDGVISEPSIYDEKILDQLGEKANGLLALKYQSAWIEVFTALAALFDALRYRGNPCLLPVVKAIGELRGSDSFHGKKEADELLGHAIRSLGPEVVLSVLPLNLDNPRAGQQGRVWLLPLLRDHVSNASLAHFKSELVPLSETMSQRVLQNGAAEKSLEAKIFQTVIHQIWSIFPGYCDLPSDLQVAMDQPFAELVSNLLYKETPLRSDLCNGLRALIESNKAILESNSSEQILMLERRTTKSDAEANLRHLATFASNLLAVLFNVYSQTLPQHRGYILQCINAFLSITPAEDLNETFNRVLTMLEVSLPKDGEPTPPKPAKSADNLPSTSHTLLDLVIVLSVHLPRSAFSSLFSLASRILRNPAISGSDPQLLKKAYKLIPRLSASPIGAEALESRSSELQSLILSTADKTPVPARRDRLLATETLVTFLPTKDLHFIPSILGEVVLACKDTNEKARQAGFGLLIHLANRMIDPKKNPPGTVIRNKKVPHMPDDTPDALASLEEVFTMVSAGLAGVAPHMVAASIAALSRLFFEFHDRLPKAVTEDLFATIEMFLQSNNREIVRSVLGFVKVAVVVLPEEMIRPRMATLVPELMVWSKENKGRLRAKVKGILERCMRKFGAAELEHWAGESDRKMIINIRKRKERTKRKQKPGVVGDASDSGDEGTKEYDNKLDEVLGSDDDSDMDDSDEDDLRRDGPKAAGRKGKTQFIRDDDEDEPLDLLAPNALANVSSKKFIRFKEGDLPKRRNKAKTNQDGKLILGDDNDTDDEDILMTGGAPDGEGAINAYVDAVDGPNAVRRGQKGKLKVGSGNQKKARVTAPGEKMELDEEEAREVTQTIMRGSRNFRGNTLSRGGKGKLPQRRGLGVEKSKQQAHGVSGKSGKGRIEKRGAMGRGKRMKFGSGRGIRR